MAIVIEVIVDRGVDGGEFLKSAHNDEFVVGKRFELDAEFI